MIHDKIKEIQNIIKPFESKWKNHKDEKALEADINWNASIFFSKIIIKAKVSNYYWSKDKLVNFSIDYNSKNNTVIDINSLIDKHWIREVLGQIKIPDAVRKITYDFEQQQLYKQELIFIRELYKHNNSKQEISKTDYSKYLEQYKKGNQLPLNETWLSEHWITSKNKEDENVKIGSIEYYYTLLDYWDDIKFISTFKNEKSNVDAKGLAISKKDFEDIHNTHKSYFINLPSISDLKQQEIIREIGSDYYLNFYNAKVSYWDSLNDKIAALVWEGIINNQAIPNDKERVKIFLNKILYWENSWAEFYKHITKSSKQLFTKVALDLVLEETDLSGIEEEFYKCYLDDNITSRYAFLANTSLSEDDLKPSKDFYEFYREMHSLSDKYQGNLFYVQEVRNHLAFLIKTIICCDYEFSNIGDGDVIRTEHFPLTKELLKSGLEKPYLLWEVCHFLVQDKPTIIPYLIVEPEFSSLAFNLMNKVKIESSINNINEEIKLKLYEKSIKLSLDKILSSSAHSNNEVGLLIFQYYKEITRGKFKSLSNVRTLDEQYTIRESHKKRENLLITLIENYPINGYNVNTTNREYLLPSIISGLVNLFKDYNEREKYLNGTIQFSILKLDGLSWLSKCINYSKYENQFSDIEKIKEELSNLFNEVYLKKIEQKSVFKKDFTVVN